MKIALAASKVFAAFAVKLAAFAVANNLDAAPSNRYESGQRWSSRRSHLPGYIQSARLDADSMTRLEILRKARYFERNCGIVNRLADLFEQYTVGPRGLRFIPASSDREWNRNAAKWWNDWEDFCDLTSLQHFGTIQSLVARSWFIDGEVFIIKTNGRIRKDGQSFPRIQLIESHRVETPQNLYGDKNVIDGIQIDDRGRPVGYWVRDDSGGPFAQTENYKFIDAENMVHIFEPSRPGMYRGLSMLYPVLNDLHDLDDLQILEMDAAKEAAKTTNVIQTKSGELNEDDLRRQRMLGRGTDGTSGGSSAERTQYYEDVFQARAKVLQTGDEFKQFVSGRPSVAVQTYWEYLVSKICAGVGISKLLVFPWSMQGTVVRADLDVAATFFRSRSYVLGGKFQDVWRFAVGWATRNNLDLSDPPSDWNRVTMRPPRSVNVDVGRNSNALIAEYEAGLRTLEWICSELGEDWRDVLREKAVELAEADELEKEFKLPQGSLVRAVIESLKLKKTNEQPAIEEKEALAA